SAAGCPTCCRAEPRSAGSSTPSAPARGALRRRPELPSPAGLAPGLPGGAVVDRAVELGDAPRRQRPDRLDLGVFHLVQQLCPRAVEVERLAALDRALVPCPHEHLLHVHSLEFLAMHGGTP